MKTNTLYAGDCLDRMAEWADECVDLIYLDPPFNSKANYNILFGKGKDKKKKNKNKKDDLAQMVAFKDTWQWDADAEERVNKICKAIDHPAHYAIKGFDALFRHSGTGMLAYLSYMAERLAEMRRLLKPTGGIFLHCDPTASHYLKIIMDEVFGGKNYQNEIIWGYRTGGASKKRWSRKHDVLFYYAKYAKSVLFHPQKETIYYDSPFFGATEPDAAGKYPVKVLKRDVWDSGSSGEDEKIKPIINVSAERLGYPTQKPIALLERIIEATSNEGDIVLDPFCGCGTTIHAAHNLKRRWAGIDISYYAIEVIRRDRMKDIVNIELQGEPTDVESAAYFSDKDPFEFEKWAVSRIHGFAPNTVQRGDGGIDGRALIWNAEGENDLCIAQVKRGKPSVDALNAFYGKIAAFEAAIGLFVTLRKQKQTPTMKKLIAKSGYMEIGGKKFNRLVMWSIEEFFHNIEPKIPHLAHPRTGIPLQEDILEKQDRIPT